MAALFHVSGLTDCYVLPINMKIWLIGKFILSTYIAIWVIEVLIGPTPFSIGSFGGDAPASSSPAAKKVALLETQLITTTRLGKDDNSMLQRWTNTAWKASVLVYNSKAKLLQKQMLSGGASRQRRVAWACTDFPAASANRWWYDKYIFSLPHRELLE